MMCSNNEYVVLDSSLVPRPSASPQRPGDEAKNMYTLARVVMSFGYSPLQVYKHLTWNDPVQPYDAFHSILFQLWRKRHIRRTQSASSLVKKL